MAYKYPDGAKTPDGIIADIVATVAWVDLVIGLKLAHMPFPINLDEPKSKNSELVKRFNTYYQKVIEGMTYRQKIDMFFELIDIKDDKQLRKDLKTLLISLGETRNKFAHNIALSLVPDNFNLMKDNVGSSIINRNYAAFNDSFSKLEVFITNIEKSMSKVTE